MGSRRTTRAATIPADRTVLQCAACGGNMEMMGRVGATGDTVVETRRTSVCDHRCTNAFGPDCNCVCTDANHGSNMVMEVVYKEGVRPSVLVCMEPDAAVARAKEYNMTVVTATKAVVTRFKDVLASALPRYKMPPRLYADAYELDAVRKNMDKACAFRDHERRLEALRKFTDKVKQG